MPLDSVTGVKEQDADKAEGAIRGIIQGIVTALHVGDILRAVRTEPHTKTEVEPAFSQEGPVEVVPLESSQAVAGHFMGGPEPELLSGQDDVPQLPGGADADALAMTPVNAPDPAIAIRVGEVTIESPLSQLAETLQQQSPETLENVRAAMQDSERSPDAPTVEIRSDDQLKFYRDTDNRFVSPDFDIQTASSKETEAAIATPPALESEVPAEVVLPESEVVEVTVEDKTPTQVVQLPVSEAEVLGGQTLAESSTVNPDVWANQTQVFTAEVDHQRDVQSLPTAAIGQSVDAIADQNELTEEAQETSVAYAEQLEDGREQTAAIADTYYQCFDERRDANAEAIAAARDDFYDKQRAVADAEAIQITADPSHNIEISANHHNIAAMLDQACDFCYGQNTGTQTIQGHYYVISRDGDSLSVTAKDGRGTLLAKKGDQVTSFLTLQDEQNLSAGFDILQQQQQRQFDAMPNTSIPAVSPPATVTGKPQLELD